MNFLYAGLIVFISVHSCAMNFDLQNGLVRPEDLVRREDGYSQLYVAAVFKSDLDTAKKLLDEGATTWNDAEAAKLIGEFIKKDIEFNHAGLIKFITSNRHLILWKHFWWYIIDGTLLDQAKKCKNDVAEKVMLQILNKYN